MSGIYLHIPFCKQACHYCNFHFSTSLRYKKELLSAMKSEIALRRDYFAATTEPLEAKTTGLMPTNIETIYLGGGTPSLLSAAELLDIFELLYRYFDVSPQAEITIEANPDDLSEHYLAELRQTPVNRLSIGVQSFVDADLIAMNRAHHAEQARTCIDQARQAGFNNLTIDLIYGIASPDSNARWRHNLDLAFGLSIPHFSAYCLTVEPKTALAWQIANGKTIAVSDEQAALQFDYLVAQSAIAGYWQYEISNFCLPHQYSRHNSAYWQGKPYLGIGPSAHSFDGAARQWNVANNAQYIKAIAEHGTALTIEMLTLAQRYNEYVMTSLRTMWGTKLSDVSDIFGADYRRHLLHEAERYIQNDLLLRQEDSLVLAPKGKFVADGIISQLMKID